MPKITFPCSGERTILSKMLRIIHVVTLVMSWFKLFRVSPFVSLYEWITPPSQASFTHVTLEEPSKYTSAFANFWSEIFKLGQLFVNL